jgi:hypothetical protein
MMYIYFQNLWFLVLIRKAGKGKTRIPSVQTASPVSAALTGATCDLKWVTGYLYVM